MLIYISALLSVVCRCSPVMHLSPPICSAAIFFVTIHSVVSVFNFEFLHRKNHSRIQYIVPAHSFQLALNISLSKVECQANRQYVSCRVDPSIKPSGAFSTDAIILPNKSLRTMFVRIYNTYLRMILICGKRVWCRVFLLFISRSNFPSIATRAIISPYFLAWTI